MIYVTRILGTFFLTVALTVPAHALYLSSSQTTPQSVSINADNPFGYSFSVSANVTGIEGGLFEMKKGTNTTQDISFTVWDDTLSFQVFQLSLGPAFFTTSLALVPFAGTYDLLAGHNYTASLTTTAPASPQNRDYGIRWGGPLSFVDFSGNPVTPPNGATLEPPNSTPTPEPVSILLLGAGMAGLAGYRFRGKKV